VEGEKERDNRLFSFSPTRSRADSLLSMLFLAFFLLALAASAARPAAALKPDTIALCYGEWLACARAEPCRALLQEAYSCVLNPLQVKGAGGSSGCFAELSKVVNVTDIPELLSLDQVRESVSGAVEP